MSIPALDLKQFDHDKLECTGGQILNFQNTFVSACNEIQIRLEIQDRHFFSEVKSQWD